MAGLFRDLTAWEIECRVGQAKAGKGLSLLLYKTARTDAAILDETVGSMAWQDAYEDVNGRLFCRIGIRDTEGEWVWKGDTGTESNIEAAKGEASDAMKRAGFKWGIGRELYSAPFIWVPESKGGKYDRFEVAKVETEGGRIRCLAIRNEKTGAIVYTYVEPGYVPKSKRSNDQ